MVLKFRIAKGLLSLVWLSAVMAHPALAAEKSFPPAGVLTDGGTGSLTRVVDGDTVILKQPIDNAQEIRLVGIQAPKLALGRAGFKPWPLAAEAKMMLEKLTLGQPVKIGFGGAKIDRYGRLLAHLYVGREERWAQGAMLSAGLARVYSFADNRALVTEMLALEQIARDARRGIWADPFYQLRQPGDTPRMIGTFQIIEAKVIDAARVKGVVYLNFGDNWRTDFTITIRPAAGRMFRDAGVDPLDFKGRTVRVRGWLKRRNGPMIEASHPEQIELVTD